MSLIKLTPDRFEHFTLVTQPAREFASSSSGVTGSISLYARTNRVLKETDTFFSSSAYFDDSIGVSQELLSLKSEASSSTNIYSASLWYLDAVTSESLSARHNKVVTVQRFTPDFLGGIASYKKTAVRTQLMPYYRHVYPSSHYAYTNYHCLNFITGAQFNTGSALIYPVSYSGSTPKTYVPTGSFCIDFYINPKNTVSASNEYRAGTILHISSSIVLSLVTGSGKDHNNLCTGFRLLLQLKNSAYIEPSSIALTGTNDTRPSPHNLVYLSDDNSLKRNNWHHVTVQWGTTSEDNGTGSFYIDGELKGQFSVPSSSITLQDSNAASLYLGNYFAGSAAIAQNRFFNNVARTNEGVRRYANVDVDPTGFTFSHPLSAELHDFKIYGKTRTINEILTSSWRAPEEIEDDLLFYLPVFFVKETFPRNTIRTPFSQSRRETNAPFNVDFGFQVGGHLLNVENFLREFVNGEYPRLFNMTASLYTGSVITSASADDYMSRDEKVLRRNLFILPCDNGKFLPNFELLRSGTVNKVVSSGSNMDSFKTDLGGTNLKFITLNDLVDNDVYQQPSVSGSLESEIEGASPENPDLPYKTVFPVLQRTRDNSSNNVVFFDIPNLYYGRRIIPGTVEIYDANITGSAGNVSIRIKDDGFGGLYRADCDTAHARWNSLGTVFYNEGILIIKTPNIPHFGKHQFTLSFKGERHIYVSKVNVLAPAGLLNSSSNPSYVDVPASLNANDKDSKFVYITGINLHDENLNVVSRTRLSQPIIKRNGDKIMFKIKMDW